MDEPDPAIAVTQLRFINPNTTTSMTDKVLQSARAVAPAGISVDAATSASGPAAIQGAEDGERALPGLLAAARQARDDGIDVAVIACFDDTGIREVRAAVDIPVLGIGQAAFAWCLLHGWSFTVVTTLAVSVPVIEANLADAGYAAGCRSVRASGVPVLALEQPGGDAEARVSQAIGEAIAADSAAAIVLGCAGMADLAARMTRRHGLPVIDGVAAATRLATVLTSVGTSGTPLRG